ncbi:DNA/RNA non-specific endonuclease [Cytophagaceae bacterium BD1B2-1]|uniref:DNA/RNA non-specific endonuclease n=1 Tax=Xanthocytophaga agilis TaxID=3048010 RepID=A0AAE3UH26_9BACT|nr:DNA/RNA non-specific endonuclease [Xanthocytophaga agilis]MDJ1503027.1 DNA/RNA non-specific endonuclease [Xanthocytophaga agilis]
MNPIRRILNADKALSEEVHELIESGKNLPIAIRNNINQNAMEKAMVGPAPELPRAEAMILLHVRPALLIKKNKVILPDSVELKNRIRPFIKKIEHVIPSVGRIEFLKAGKKYGGTGWLITEDTIVTNRHVASLVAMKKGKSFVFRKNPLGDTMEALIDFKEEYWGDNVAVPEFEVELEKIVYMTEDNTTQPDIAFFKIKKHNKLPEPIVISTRKIIEKQFVSVIGYPAYDPNSIISTMAAKEVFNNIYEVKRCSPGEILEDVSDSWYFYHDCTTLGGNSGSVVVDNETGSAVGLHFMGEVEKENYAVKGEEILKHLRKVSPKFVTGDLRLASEIESEQEDVFPESAPEDYNDRAGYLPDFLGKNYRVPLPQVTRDKDNVLTFELYGETQSELKYHHFTVVMNRERRQCFYSACNIDGLLSKRGVKRTGWKYDSRIPKEFQIKNECYGNPPKFSRGHMTRKEDPIWGDLALAKAAGGDSFHVTNATPQMQSFNAPVWLALEDYALENARQDAMKISVFTGPIFTEQDPVKYGVKIPVDFFKILVFIHDTTRKLCATGYTVSQKDHLSNQEFVFGEFETYQVSIKSIERRTGLHFGSLSSVDPIKGLEAFGAPLAKVEEIRFV